MCGTQLSGSAVQHLEGQGLDPEAIELISYFKLGYPCYKGVVSLINGKEWSFCIQMGPPCLELQYKLQIVINEPTGSMSLQNPSILNSLYVGYSHSGARGLKKSDSRPNCYSKLSQCQKLIDLGDRQYISSPTPVIFNDRSLHES